MKKQKTANKPPQVIPQKRKDETRIITQEAEPVKPQELNPVKPPESKGWKYAFIGLAAAIFATMILLSLDAGNSGDEDGFQIPQSEVYYNYYASMGKDTITTIEGMEYYPIAFDIVVTALQHGFKIDNTANFRHCCNSAVGWLAILFAGLLAMRIAGWRAGIFTMLLLFLSPRFLGHSFNNPKDIPFAALMMMGLYYSTRFIQQLPKVKTSAFLLLGVTAGLATASRIAGMLIFCYWALFLGIYFFAARIHKNKNIPKNPRHVKEKSKKPYLKTVLLIVAMFAIAYIIALALSPYAHKEPIKAFKIAFDTASHFKAYLRQLFEGAFQWSHRLPWYYTPKYILITIPLAVILGFLLYPFVGGLKKDRRFTTFIVYFACIFPVAWIIFSNANVYGGWRHAMFAYPPMVVAAGLGFSALIDLCKNRYLKIACMALPLLLLVLPLSHILRNHPYEYVYFNEIGGGVKKAYGKYELDYYYHSTREASEWIIKNAKKDSLVTGDKIIVATWHAPSVNYYLRNDTARFQTVFSRWDSRGNIDWDYAIFVVTGIPPEQINGKHFPPANTIHSIDVDGKPICLILKRNDKSDYQAMQYMELQDAVNSILFLEKALAHDPYNETALINLIGVYYIIGQLDEHIYLLDRAREYIPKYRWVNWYHASLYMMKKDYDQVIKISNQALADDYSVKEFYRLLYEVYQQKKEYKSAEKTLLKMIENDLLESEDADRLVAVYKAQGMNDMLALRKFYKLMQSRAEKKGEKETAEHYRNALEEVIKGKKNLPSIRVE